nr:hypothetical transcript [Hymenolepis microstoma]
MSDTSRFRNIKLHLKFRNKFAIIDVPRSSNIEDLIESIALLLSFKASRLGVSLDSKKFFHLCDGKLRLEDVGIVPGDLIYVISDVAEEDIALFRSTEEF